MNIADLNDIRIFVAVGQEGTLSAAAINLQLPPSTVSRALTRLEKSLDVLLVKRTPRGLTLTDFGKEYLAVCRKALRTLREGGETLAAYRERPSGLIKVACPITMAQSIFAPLLKSFLERYPGLQVDIEPYSSSFDQEPRQDIDIFFKVLAPGDSVRRMRRYPGVNRGLFASKEYLKKAGIPSSPEDLVAHTCIGSGSWRLRDRDAQSVPNVRFQVITYDPEVHFQLVLQAFGIAVMPLYMQTRPEAAGVLVHVLPTWSAPPIPLCALFSGQSRLTPKVQVLLDFLDEYIGTPQDPRLFGPAPRDCFVEAGHPVTSRPETKRRS